MKETHFLSVAQLKSEAIDLLKRPIRSKEDVVEYLAAHYDCKAKLRDFDETYKSITELASRLSADAAKYAMENAEELGLKFVESQPGIRHAVLKTSEKVYILVETALDKGKPPVYLWCRPYRANLNAWKEILPERKGNHAKIKQNSNRDCRPLGCGMFEFTAIHKVTDDDNSLVRAPRRRIRHRNAHDCGKLR